MASILITFVLVEAGEQRGIANGPQPMDFPPDTGGRTVVATIQLHGKGIAGRRGVEQRLGKLGNPIVHGMGRQQRKRALAAHESAVYKNRILIHMRCYFVYPYMLCCCLAATWFAQH